MTQKETIFLQTDPAFNSVLLAISELRDKNRFQVINCQTAWICLIESDDPERKNRFGGKKAATMSNVSFGRTASTVARMCMHAESSGYQIRVLADYRETDEEKEREED